MACDKNTAEENPIHGADTAQQALALFCESEFADEATRYNYVGLSSERKRLEELRNNEPLQLNTDPLFIVSTYHVSGVHFDDTTGKGKVVFERLAYTRGLGNDVNYNPNPPREIIPEYKESEEVDYDLKKINGRWYVYDPPVMRVSLAAVDKYYFGQATSFLPNDFWIAPKFSNEQRKNIAKKFNDIKVLMQISADYLERLRERYKDAGGPVHPDKERQKRVKASYTGKWNIEILSETQPKLEK